MSENVPGNVNYAHKIFDAWQKVGASFAIGQVLHPANLRRDITNVELLQMLQSFQEQDPNLTAALKNWHQDHQSPFLQFLEFNDYPQIKLAFEVLNTLLYPQE